MKRPESGIPSVRQCWLHGTLSLRFCFCTKVPVSCRSWAPGTVLSPAGRRLPEVAQEYGAALKCDTKSVCEERSAGSPHATCGSRRRGRVRSDTGDATRELTTFCCTTSSARTALAMTECGTERGGIGRVARGNRTSGTGSRSTTQLDSGVRRSWFRPPKTARVSRLWPRSTAIAQSRP